MQGLLELEGSLPRIEECGVDAAVRIERVVGSVSAPLIEPYVDLDGDDGAELTEDVAAFDDLPGVMQRVSSGRSVVIALLAGLVAGVAMHDGRVAVVVGGGAWLFQQLRVFDGMIPFSFGEGFIGYRGDPAWPQGVQEDDDLKWSWRAAPSAASQRHPHAAIPGK